MAIVKIDITLFKKMVMNGAINLKNFHKEVDELNVFPIPDGDTGTNMQMTIMSGVREMANLQSTSLVELAKILSRGTVMGSRGNSGVILSQYFRGFYVGLKDMEENYLTTEQLTKCLVSAYKTAYNAVKTPVEGTILTVVREAAEKVVAKKEGFDNIEDLLDYYCEAAKESLAHTPELLPVLKEAGVVDSGGAGFLKILEGMILAVKGTILEAEPAQNTATEQVKDVYKYCIECYLTVENPSSFSVSDLKSPLSLLGNEVRISYNNEVVTLHIHTNKPGRVLENCQKYGEFTKVKIENMSLSHTQMICKDEFKETRKKMAVVSVCFGDGITQAFKDLGVDLVIEGGQTMNPPTEEFVKAVQKVNADNVLILPNNGNVVMAAKQAISLCEGVNVHVLPAKTIAQGYASLINYSPSNSLEENVQVMEEAIYNVGSGEVTYSIRDTEIKGVKIANGDFMGIANGEIVVSTKDRLESTERLLDNLLVDGADIVTIFYGADATDEEVSQIEGYLNETYPDLEVETINGQQEIYTYIIAVE